jgi:hypothetical protein
MPLLYVGIPGFVCIFAEKGILRHVLVSYPGSELLRMTPWVFDLAAKSRAQEDLRAYTTLGLAAAG